MKKMQLGILTASLIVGSLMTGWVGCSIVPIKPIWSGHKGLLDSEQGDSEGAGSSEAVKEAVSDPSFDLKLSPKRSGRWGILKPDQANSLVSSDAIVRELKNFYWPLNRVDISSSFGKRGRKFHEGIDLRARTGTPVFAAQSGIVLYSASRVRGYGKMIVIRHFGNLSTIYAHNSRLLVRSGHRVRRGQLIAYSGKSGHVTGPHLHFEVRYGVSAIDPANWIVQVADQQVRSPSRNKARRRKRSEIQAKRAGLNTKVTLASRAEL